MNPMEKSGWTPFPNSEEAAKQARTVPQTLRLRLLPIVSPLWTTTS